MTQIQRLWMIQQQKLLMTPEIKMMLKLLALPVMDLREAIFEEAEKNPALEIVKDSVFDRDVRVKRKSAIRTSSHISAASQLAGDNFQSFLESIEETRGQSLQSHLLKQASLIKTDEETAALARLIIQNLDEKGFNVVSLEELINAQPERLRLIFKQRQAEAVNLVQTLEPQGCAVNNFNESLEVQARCFYEENKEYLSKNEKKIILLARTLLEKYFSRLKSGRVQEIVRVFAAEKMEVTENEAENILKFIKTLNPFPGLKYSGERIEKDYIIPDIYVKKTEEGFSAIINNEQIPIINISSVFKKEADKEGSPDKKGKNFTRQAVKSAEAFIGVLNQRQQTILKIVQTIILFQQDFFRYGPAHLCPLRLQDVAEEVGFSVSTISRAAKGKYLDCEWGIFEIGHFFTAKVISKDYSYNLNPYQSYSSSGFSKETIKAAIKELIDTSEEKLSDQKISDLLKDRNLPVSRRTVNKYRTEMQIASSYDRGK